MSSSDKLLHCISSPILEVSEYCDHTRDAGVVCEGSTSDDWQMPAICDSHMNSNHFFAAPCSNGEIRLSGGSLPYEGRVEVCQNNIWGVICTNNWEDDEATVVCGQLDYLSQG